LLGETEEYEPLSRAAFFKAQLRDKVVKLEVKDAEEIKAEKIPKKTGKPA